MKHIYKYLLLSLATLSPLISFAQSETDAYKLTETGFYGTARYQSMAGAFSSLGGDVSSIMQNPAGIGVFHRSELTFSGGLSINSYNSNWYKFLS